MNPIWKLAKQCALVGEKNHPLIESFQPFGTCTSSNGEDISKEVEVQLDALYEATDKASNMIDGEPSKLSLEDAFVKQGGWTPATSQAGKLAEFVGICDGYAEEYENISYYNDFN